LIILPGPVCLFDQLIRTSFGKREFLTSFPTLWQLNSSGRKREKSEQFKRIEEFPKSQKISGIKIDK
jgi:hypothetical protein